MSFAWRLQHFSSSTCCTCIMYYILTYIHVCMSFGLASDMIDLTWNASWDSSTRGSLTTLILLTAFCLPSSSDCLRLSEQQVLQVLKTLMDKKIVQSLSLFKSTWLYSQSSIPCVTPPQSLISWAASARGSHRPLLQSAGWQWPSWAAAAGLPLCSPRGWGRQCWPSRTAARAAPRPW